MSKQRMIPEWVGSTLTNGAFLDCADEPTLAPEAQG